MAREPEITVVIPAHEAASTIGECVAALASQSLEQDRYEVVLVDTGEDGTRQVAEDAAGPLENRFRYVRAAERGPAAQRNQGAELASAQNLAFVDADCVADHDWLRAGLRRLEEGAALVQGRTTAPAGQTRGAFDHAIEVEFESGLFESCNVMYERGAFERAGGFVGEVFERTGEHFGEDALLAWAVIRSGGEAVFEPRALVRHAVVSIPFASHLRYQAKSRNFPFLVRSVPELRERILIGRLFLGSRSLRYDAALLGIVLARRFPLAAVLCAPYASDLYRHGLPARRRLPFAVKRLVADSVRFAALVRGSVENRSAVL